MTDLSLQDVEAEQNQDVQEIPQQTQILPPHTPSGKRKQNTPTTPKKVRRDIVIPVNKIKEHIDEQLGGKRNGFVTEFKVCQLHQY